jgi:hypothetical protein
MKSRRWAGYNVLRPNGQSMIYELDNKGQLLVRPPKNKRRAFQFTEGDGGRFREARFVAGESAVQRFSAAPQLPMGLAPVPAPAPASVRAEAEEKAETAALTTKPSTTGSSGPYAEQREAQSLHVDWDSVNDNDDFFW